MFETMSSARVRGSLELPFRGQVKRHQMLSPRPNRNDELRNTTFYLPRREKLLPLLDDSEIRLENYEKLTQRQIMVLVQDTPNLKLKGHIKKLENQAKL